MDNYKTNVIVSIDPQLQEMSEEYQFVILQWCQMGKHKELFCSTERQDSIFLLLNNKHLLIKGKKILVYVAID